MEVNSFLAGRRKPTPTDAVLAKCYYPMLCELAKQKKEMTFKEFVDAAKERYPNVEEVQNAIPVSTGRRFEYVRTYTTQYDLPDLSAWVVSQAGTNSDDYEADFDPQAERDASSKINWDDYEGHWSEFVEQLTKLTIKIKRRKRDEARKIMAKYAKELRAKIEAHIPNPKKLKYATLVTPFADPIIESLMEGNEVEVAFDNVIFDMTQSRSAGAAE
jgi:hypothetical protein